jgi:uncharacterized protein YyaL (SSP411 family)
MLFILVVGVIFKGASRLLPERQPNALDREYSGYLRAASRQPIEWTPLSEEAFRTAEREGKLVLVAITSPFSEVSRLMDLDQFVDSEFAFIVNSHFVPVRVDAEEAADFALEMSLNTATLEAAGGALFFAMEPDGTILSTSLPVSLRGKAGVPGLVDWIGDLKRDYAARNPRVRQEAERLRQERVRVAALVRKPLDVPDDELATTLGASVRAGVAAMASYLSPDQGALKSIPSPISAPIPELLLLAGPDGQSVAATWLLRLRESACYDQLWGGFFTASREPGWRVPEFAKQSGRMALLAETYARASLVLNAPLFEATARETLDLLLRELRDPESGLFIAGLQAALPSDEGGIPYVRAAASPNVPAPFVRDSATGALRLGASASLAAGASDQRVTAISRARTAMVENAGEMKHAARASELYAEVNGQAISALFTVGRLLNEPRYVEAAERAYAAAVRMFVVSGDVVHAADGRFRHTGYLGGYAWMARAAMDRYLATGSEDALSDVGRYLDRIRILFGVGGGYRAVLQSRYPYLVCILGVESVADLPDEALCATLLRTLTDYSRATGDEAMGKAALDLARAYAQALDDLAPRSAGMLRAVALLLEPAVVVKSSSAVEDAAMMARRFPIACVLPASAEHTGLTAMPNGVYAIGLNGIRRLSQ